MLRLVLLRILEGYFRHRWLYIIPVVVMVGLGVLSIFISDPKYIAEGVMYVQKESLLASLTSVRDTGFSFNTPAQDTSTELSDLMQTDAFIRAIIQKTNLEEKMVEGPTVIEDTIKEAREAIWAIPLGNSQVLISGAYEDPVIAYQLVNGTIENFIQWKKNSEQVESETALSFFQELLDAYKADLEATRTELENYLIAHPEPERGNRPDLEILEIERLQSDLQLAGTRYAKAQDNVESARLALAQVESDTNQTYILIDNPTIPVEPEISLKDIAIQLAIFFAGGVLLSILGIGGNVLFDRSFLFPVDVHNLIELPVLASIPDFSEEKKSNRSKASKVDQEHPGSGNRKSSSSPISPNGNTKKPSPHATEPSEEMVRPE